MRNAALLLLLCATGTAGAQPLYKCTGADGRNSYQSTPCAEGEVSATRAQASRSMGAAPVPAPSSGTAQASATQRRAQVRHATTAANATCDGARAQRTAALGAAGAAATAELRASLDRDVQDACR